MVRSMMYGLSGNHSSANSQRSDYSHVDEEEVYVNPANFGEEEDIADEFENLGTVVDSGFKPSPSVKLQSSDILDCPTCCEPLKPPIYQCNNGHLACSSCCNRLNNICSFCRLHIGFIRCRAMEKIIETTLVTCPNSIYGCQEKITYGDHSIHENHCLFIQCSCPCCDFTGSYLEVTGHAYIEHSADKDNLIIPVTFNIPLHFGMKKMAVFQEEEVGHLIVVQAFMGVLGMYVTVSCIASRDPDMSNFSCNLANISDDGTLRMGLRVKKVQKVEEEDELPKDGFMLIPSNRLTSDILNLQICIGRDDEYLFV